MSAALPALHPGDLVALRLEPGPAWLEVAEEAWRSGAAIFPVDHRSAGTEAEELLSRADPTVVIDARDARRLRASGPGDREGDPGDPSGALAALVATSGTSHSPRLAELSRSAVEAAVLASLEALGSEPTHGWISSLPLSHVGGLLVALRGIVSGAQIDLRPRFDPADFASGPAVLTSVVPTMLTRLLDAHVDLRRFRAILVGGSALGEPLHARAVEAGANIVATYGLTESCGGVVYDGAPLPGVRVRIGPELEVQIAGPSLMRGYRGDPEATRAAFTNDGWLRCNDAGELVDGRLHVLGRTDDAILTGGEKVWPDEVEALLAAHPGVASVAVAGRPDAEWGARVVAWVIPRDPSAPPTLEEVRAFVSARTASYRAPKELVIVAELPATALGKARRDALPG